MPSPAGSFNGSAAWYAGSPGNLFGGGDVFLSTLRMGVNLSSDEPNSAVAKKLFLNLLEK